MVSKADFTPEEWKTVLSSPMLASMAVTLAEPSGLWGILKEGMASGRALLDASNDANASGIAKAIVADIGDAAGRTDAREAMKAQFSGKSPEEMKRQILVGLSEAARVVDAKAPAEARAFKAWLVDLARKVAEASSEGGFLGFGGVKVSDAEKASIADVERALA